MYVHSFVTTLLLLAGCFSSLQQSFGDLEKLYKEVVLTAGGDLTLLQTLQMLCSLNLPPICFIDLFKNKPFHDVGSVPAGHSVTGGQLTHTQLIRQAAIVRAVETQAVQKVPAKAATRRRTDN